MSNLTQGDKAAIIRCALESAASQMLSTAAVPKFQFLEAAKLPSVALADLYDAVKAQEANKHNQQEPIL